jgi:hypothetical protein
MNRKISGRQFVYISAVIAIVVAAAWALLFVPRLGTHPEAVGQGVDRSSKLFFAVQLIATLLLLVCIILSRRGRKIIVGLLYLAAALILLHDFMVFNGAVYYLEYYEGFSAEAILMMVCVGANLIAAILTIKAGNRYRLLMKAGGGGEAGLQ